MSANTEELDMKAQLQVLLLQDYLRLLKLGEATPADRASLGRLLVANGWSLDDRDVPKGIKSFMTKSVDPKKLDDDEASAVVGRIA